MDRRIRLKDEEIEIIKEVAIEIFGEDAKVYIFGSRVDLTKKGGDIDIFIETQKEVSLNQEIEFLAKLEIKGVERSVDVLIKAKNRDNKPIFEEAKRTGVLI
ncbi:MULTISPECIES: nucleotidyltransferase domain-containing protein [unclassified Hydrogenobaculum]|jgi:Nucleotidyltransferase domain.|uniref:nucleotidyltransferase domain-containing protein n=1 Tax=unclassified Hydrogenobaculum TaxID=2622382 RepID=UPI0001C51A08|nr:MULTISPECIES: nucleotidyltransferase domain-containing protein [unclassified Hydrogenobaculum]AEF19522.1 DNA polymerase beta domain protein region [Hydrogenobaculum sp. 3684]AEG46810.1 DNA polymerase beta domain protein region [Hydrogenobaculum sp. SHO]AGG15456.1 DNA polymerase beta domain protein region [Hydrogenobaculum sp. HO]AGH93757.1 nucleotidyltransferase family protein [Hydrogenobaculum sp. SN]